MRVVVYVEGESDSLSMLQLLRPLIRRKKDEGIDISFHPSLPGRNKHSALTKIPLKAFHILRAAPDSYIAVIPDLYPLETRDVPFKHESADELIDVMRKGFKNVLADNGIDDDSMVARFIPFCFKYELEALVLAATDELQAFLGVDDFSRSWTIPVEEQNDAEPPKQVVRELFREVNKRYIEKTHAPYILSAADYSEIAERCPQCFKPFVDFSKGSSGCSWRYNQY